jgi:hypothetical protein
MIRTALDQARTERRTLVVCLVLVALFSLRPVLVAQSGGQYVVESSVVSAGGGPTAAGASLDLIGTIGQPIAGGTASGPPYQLYSGFWSPGQPINAVPVPFVETFANNDAGWTLDEEWQIGPAMTSTGHEIGNPDPGTDTTPTMDNGVAGIVIGGNASIEVHGFRYLTSPPIDGTTGPGTSLILSFNRWLNSDRMPWMNNRVEVWDGDSWEVVWESGMTTITDNAWVPQSFDITAYQNAALRVRFGISTGTDGQNLSWIVSSWNIDDVSVTLQSDIEVRGNGLGIANGDETPSLTNGTDFGSADVSSGTATRTFSIHNLGTTDINLTGNPVVEITGVNASDFSVTAAPATSIGVAESTDMQLRFVPSGHGLRTATVSIVNDVPNASPYTFAIQGTGASLSGLHFRTVKSGDWTNTFTWEQSDDGGNTWTPASTTPTAANSDSIALMGAFAISVTTAITVDQVVQLSGNLEIEAGGTIVVNDGPGDDLTVSSLDSLVNLRAGGSMVNNGQVNISGFLQIWDASAFAGNDLRYSFPGFLIYVSGTHITTNFEFPAENSPAAVGVAGAHVTLHAPRTLLYVGLAESGVFNIGTNLTLANDAAVERFCADCTLNGTPIFEDRVHLNYFNQNMSTGSEVPEAAGVLQQVFLGGVDELTLLADMTINELLQLNSGRIITGDNILTLVSGDLIADANDPGYVIGNFRKALSLEPGSTPTTFEVGTHNGYSPVAVTYNISAPGIYGQTVSATQGTHPNFSDPAKALSRYWTLSEITGPSEATADITFHYIDPTDIPITAMEANFVIHKYSGTFSQPGGTVDTETNTATITNVTSFSDWSLAEPGAAPALIVVDTLIDDGTLSACTSAADDCSLRGAVSIAQDGDTIVFTGLELFSAGVMQSIVLGGTELVIASDITIDGPGADELTISGNNASRVFSIGAGVTVEISGLTIADGDSGTSNGGGVSTAGTRATFDGVHFVSNSANNGGALAGTNIVIRNSTLSGNDAAGSGGAISCLIGNLTIENSTISGNVASGFSGSGGGLFLLDPTTILRSVTITNNTASAGGGIRRAGFSGDLLIGNSIIAENNGIIGVDEISNVETIVSDGFNLILSTGGSNMTLQSSDITGQDPQLGLLADNGGPTPTHALLLGSPAVDAGSAFGLTTDQRGAPRPVDLPNIPNVDDGTDIGAYEMLAPTAANITLGGRVMDSQGRGINGARMTLTGSNGEQRFAITNPFGYYTFEGLSAGESFIIGVFSRRHTFAMPQILITAESDIADLDFVATGP